MNHVKTIWDGDYALQHHWFLDDFGLKKNYFDIIHHQKDGSQIHYPFFGDIRVTNYNKGTAYGGDDISPYTDQEYREMLRKQIKKIKN